MKVKPHHKRMMDAINHATAVDVRAHTTLLEVASGLVNSLGFIAAYEADGNQAVLFATLDTISEAIAKVAQQRAAEIKTLAAEDALQAIAVKP